MLDAIRSALRQIRSQPGFAAAVILTIAVGVGATTAVFTLADRMLFRPLPFPQPERLVRLRQEFEGGQALLRVGDYLRLERDHQGLESITHFGLATAGRLEGLGDETILFDGVSEGFFAVFGLQPVRGRTFTAEEYGTRTALPDVAMITYGLWQSAFAGRDDVIGQMLRVEGPRPQSFRIVGVLPPAFMTPSTVNQQAQIILPMRVDPAQATDPRFGADPVLRLRAGVSLEAAAAEAQAIVSAVERDVPQFDQGRRVVVIPLQESLFGPVRTPLMMLLGVTLCALLLACANLAQLFLARLHARRREIGVRLAIGAGPWRLVRQFVTEAGVLAVVGGAAALLFARATVAFIMARTPDFSHVYRLLPAEIDLRVAAFAALLVAFALTIYGVLPALLASRPDVRSSLQTGGTSTPAWGRRDAGLIFLQSAMALALLVTGTLIVRSYVGLSTQELGFEPDGVQRRAFAATSTSICARGCRHPSR
jgi:putative ABC transport system permease protein